MSTSPLPLATPVSRVMSDVDAGVNGKTDRMTEGLEIVDAGGAGETDRMDEGHIVEQSCENCVSKLGKEIVKVVQTGPLEYVQQRIDEHIVDVPVPQIFGQIAEVVSLVSHEHVRDQRAFCGRSISSNFRRDRRGAEFGPT